MGHNCKLLVKFVGQIIKIDNFIQYFPFWPLFGTVQIFDNICERVHLILEKIHR